MTTHHAQGIELAKLGIERARNSHLKTLAELMVAQLVRHADAGLFVEGTC